jgi:diadenylate cyclase
MFQELADLGARIRTYPPWQIGIELMVIWIVVYVIVKLVEGTRAAAALKSVFFLIIVVSLVIRILNPQNALGRLNFLYSSIAGVAAIGLIIIFQPELRRGLTRLGERPLFGRRMEPATLTVDAVSNAAAMLAKAKFGALIVIERSTPLKDLTAGGEELDAVVSSRLLQSIFFPGTALHDLSVIIKNDRIKAAGVQLPLAEAEDMPELLGSRHRAAMGISQESDALVVVVSEETGMITLVERGVMTRGLNEGELSGLLLLKLNKGLVSAVQDIPERAEPVEATVEGAGV